MRTKPLVIIQARLGSSRLPEKILKKVNGETLLEILIKRVELAKNISGIVIATTEESNDDSLHEFCKLRGWQVYRGSESNVLERYYQAAKLYDAKSIVRLTSDCPLICPKIIDSTIAQFLTNEIDYVFTRIIPSFPRGLDVEVFTMEALTKTFIEAKYNDEKEHVTPYIYNHPEKFRIINYSNYENRSDLRITVDTEEDFNFIKHIFEANFENRYTMEYEDITKIIDKNPNWLNFNKDIKQKSFGLEYEQYLKNK